MRFFKSFRLLHRRTKSESDVSALFPKANHNSPAPVKRSHSAQYVQDSTSTSTSTSDGTAAPIFVSLEHSLPSFDPTELYSPLVAPWMPPAVISPNTESVAVVDARFLKLQADFTQLKESKDLLEKDLDDLRADLSNTRSQLYSEMFRTARHQRQANTDFQLNQKLELRYQQLVGVLVGIGIPRGVVERIRQVLATGTGDPDDILLDAIQSAIQDSNSPLAKLSHVAAGPRTPEQYQSALNMTLSVRKEAKAIKKACKFWKKLAQEDGRHADTVTPSSSNISSIHEALSPERQTAVNALIARRRSSRGADSSCAYEMESKEFSLDALATEIVSRPRTPIHSASASSHSVSPSVFVVACDSTSTAHLPYLSVVTPHLGDITKDGLLTPSRSSSHFAMHHSSGRQSKVLGQVDTNVSRTSPFRILQTGPVGEPEVREDQANTSDAAMTLSRELIQNLGRVSLGHGHRRNSSIASQRSNRTSSNSLYLSTSSPVRSLVSAISDAFPTLDDEDDQTTDRRSMELDHGHMRRTSDISDSDVSFDNSAFHCLLYGANSPSVSADGDISSPDGGDGSVSGVASEDVSGPGHNSQSRFLEHINEYSNGALLALDSSVSTSTSASPGLEGISEESKESLFVTSQGTPTTGPTTPSNTPPSAGSESPKTNRSKLPVLKHLRRLSSSSTPSPNGIANKIRGLPRWVRSPGGTESGSESTDTSPVQVSAIPVIHRRRTIRARRLSMSGRKATVGLGMS
ncbi:hypothetical protein BV22DRAFT_100061 [Leucogyrophana mollusca]|uniref:Uncharacterized protein n=1 Tax=Leucogyrophana mollusca TaxID=85980 RepID=A0ACB8BV65_9AGAM|nr:hypothetical protein BV22DRAFT_100061 [Leucogyrophana mollusca]